MPVSLGRLAKMELHPPTIMGGREKLWVENSLGAFVTYQ